MSEQTAPRKAGRKASRTADRAAGDRSAAEPPGSRTTAQMRALRFDAGCLALDLVATLGRRHGAAAVERLDGPERLRAWCDGVGVRLRAQEAGPGGTADPPRTGPSAELLADLLALREAVYDIASADLHGTAPARQSVALVNAYALHEPPVPRLELADGSVGVVQPALSGPHLLALVARDLVALLADPARRAALRACEGPQCRMLYLDTTPGRRRRWCSMKRCGNSAKAARHRTRAAAPTTPARDPA